MAAAESTIVTPVEKIAGMDTWDLTVRVQKSATDSLQASVVCDMDVAEVKRLVWFEKVTTGGPAAVAGIEHEDIIVSINGKAVHSDVEAASSMKGGTDLTFLLRRIKRHESHEVEDAAAAKLEAAFRGHHNREHLDELKDEKKKHDEEEAAAKAAHEAAEKAAAEAAAHEKEEADKKAAEAAAAAAAAKAKAEQAAVKLEAAFRGHEARLETHKLAEEQKALDEAALAEESWLHGHKISKKAVPAENNFKQTMKEWDAKAAKERSSADV